MAINHERTQQCMLSEAGYKFSNEHHFTIFEVEKATEYHCSGHYPNKLFNVFQLLEHLVKITRFLQINENLNLLLLAINYIH